ncbi:hypothetical protein ES707_08591 [subsurface metagenome]
MNHNREGSLLSRITVTFHGPLQPQSVAHRLVLLPRLRTLPPLPCDPGTGARESRHPGGHDGPEPGDASPPGCRHPMGGGGDPHETGGTGANPGRNRAPLRAVVLHRGEFQPPPPIVPGRGDLPVDHPGLGPLPAQLRPRPGSAPVLPLPPRSRQARSWERRGAASAGHRYQGERRPQRQPPDPGNAVRPDPRSRLKPARDRSPGRPGPGGNLALRRGRTGTFQPAPQHTGDRGLLPPSPPGYPCRPAGGRALAPHLAVRVL